MSDDSQQPQPQETSSFTDLGVEDNLVAALSEAGITSPFPIQEMAIPIALTGADLIGQARTGTGKTLAFGLPLLQHVLLDGDDDFDDLEAPGKPQALVMTPTRELALQITAEIGMANKHRGARVLTVYGGVGYDDQIDTLADGVDIVVGTPGRLLDLVGRRILDLTHVEHLVLDEADEMLDMGFLPDVERIVAQIPADRQSLLFSATMPAPIVALARANMHQPVHVRAEGHEAQLTVPETTQFVYQTHDLDKPEILGKLLQAPGVTKIMVFTRTKRSAQRLADELVDRGFSAVTIHGDLSQQARERALKRFRKGDATVLVATDVAARGIDVAGVSHVVNYECPDDEKTYVHRIGRTGRAGNTGVAVTFVDWADVTRWKVINRVLDLTFPDPPESYSTTPGLLADLAIPDGTKGRLIPPRPREPREDRDRRDHGGRGGRDHDRGGRSSRGGSRGHDRDRDRDDRDRRETDRRDAPEAPAEDKPRQERATHRRHRRRTHNGQPVASTPQTQE
ncbi:MAG: DEAD/DEAH box helicase [Propionibacteriaceae bacterium]|nr:DEAD/DEAH box helicase [Propionibacteriaceae bacterium]